ncbi:ketose-bisphosphate aldolase [Brachyspira pilosicoli]|uniref:ketose-bisphosphate aldolase n=1 Tax=Brachyspira pilosicoli TaxID=52584 RepID=UPI001CA4834A|nr:ketose-bisphosphate aldolase [Brachyspira pilosicoli]
MHYKELGLVNPSEIFKKAYNGQYAIPAFNFISVEQINAIFDACIENNSPVILIVSPNLIRQIEPETVAYLVKANIERAKRIGKNIPASLFLDHGMKFEDCVLAIDNGFSAVMIDGSALSFEDNIELTKKVTEYAHKREVAVEAELGALSGEEEPSDSEDKKMSIYTDPKKAEIFIKETNIDCLAVSVGTSHGLVKIKSDSKNIIKYDIIKEIENRVPNFPLVLHGSSSLKKEIIDMVNNYGGNIEKAEGIPEDEIKKIAKTAICKINIASDGWITALAYTRKILAENPKAIDPRVYTLPIRKELYKLYSHKIELLGSKNRI